MGVRARKSSYESRLEPVQKLRAGIKVVMAMVRMKKAGRKWAKIRDLGERAKRVGIEDRLETKERDGGRIEGRR